MKPGGELYFADVYCDRRLSDDVRADPVLYGECLGGALYWNDFLPMAKRAGFLDPRLVTSRPLEIKNEAIKRKLGQAKFFSATYRLFKLEGLETACEDYGQAVIYQGSVPGSPHAFMLDGHHLIETGKVFPVCGNTWRMLADTRFAPHFDFIGDFATHYGIFPGCGTSIPFATSETAKPAEQRLLLAWRHRALGLSFPRKRESSKRCSQINERRGYWIARSSRAMTECLGGQCNSI